MWILSNWTIFGVWIVCSSYACHGLFDRLRTAYPVSSVTRAYTVSESGRRGMWYSVNTVFVIDFAAGRGRHSNFDDCLWKTSVSSANLGCISKSEQHREGTCWLLQCILCSLSRKDCPGGVAGRLEHRGQRAHCIDSKAHSCGAHESHAAVFHSPFIFSLVSVYCMREREVSSSLCIRLSERTRVILLSC